MKELDVLLINPRQSPAMRCTAAFPPFALYQLVASLDAHMDCTMEIIDFETSEYCQQTYENVLRERRAQVFMVTATTHARFEAVDVIRWARQTNPTSLIAVGGPHFGNTAEDALTHVPEIDVVARGEGELTAVDLLRLARGEVILDEIRGISYRSSIGIVHAEPRTEVQDLDELRSLTDYVQDKYKMCVLEYPEESIPAATIMTSRGCPFNCVFCSMASRKVRYRDPERVVDEMEHIVDAYGIKGFNFLDATLTANRKHIRRLCETILERGLDVKWWCESRVNVSLDTLDLMKAAGCVAVQIGVESGSDRVLERIRKGITRRQVTDFCRYCNKIGLYVKPLYMFSLPDETLVDVLKTFELSKSLLRFPYVTPCQVNFTEVYPGTALEKTALQKGILREDHTWYRASTNKVPVNWLLGREIDSWDHIPVYIDRLSPRIIARLIKAERCLDASAVGLRALRTQPGRAEFLARARKRLVGRTKRLVRLVIGARAAKKLKALSGRVRG